MEEAIRTFTEQFSYQPTVTNRSALKPFKHVVIGGMGGSHLAGDFLKMYKPPFTVFVHTDYGLPALPEEVLKESLFVASSYSGNTEETLDFAQTVLDLGYALAAIGAGGKLMGWAPKYKLPHVLLLGGDIQPRAAVGHSLLALLTLLDLGDIKEELREAAVSVTLASVEKEAQGLAGRFSGGMTHIYASRENWPLAFFWKINFNETAKLPSAVNYFPELNHNEINSFGNSGAHNKSPNNNFLFLRDASDHPRIQKRMDTTADMYRANGFDVADLHLTGNISNKLIYNSLLAMQTTFLVARAIGADPDSVPVIEDFKKRIA